MVKKRKSIHPTESAIQASYLVWLNLQYPEVADVTAAFVNGGARDPRYGARLKREGLKNGFPDIGIFYPCGPYHGMFIEFKSLNGTMRIDQLSIMEKLICHMYKFVVCRSLEEAINETQNYINNSENTDAVGLSRYSSFFPHPLSPID